MVEDGIYVVSDGQIEKVGAVSIPYNPPFSVEGGFVTRELENGNLEVMALINGEMSDSPPISGKNVTYHCPKGEM